MNRFASFLVLLAGCSDSGITVHNAPPEANVVTPEDGTTVAEGAVVFFLGTASDPDKGDALATEWRSGEDVLCAAAPPLGDGSTTCEAALSSGQEVVTLVVTDQDDASGEDDVTLVIVADQSPEAAITAPDPKTTWYEGDLIPFEGVVSDEEDDPEDLEVWWESSLDGRLDVEALPEADGTVAGSAALSAGQHELALRVRDSAGQEGSDTLLLTVSPPNTAPWCEITAPEDNSLGEAGDPVAFAGVVGDAETAAELLSVTWSSDLMGELSASSADSDGNVGFTTTDLVEGTHVVTLLVTDALGLTCADDVLYSVGTPPSITLHAPDGGDVYDEGDEIAFSATVSDPDHAASDVTLSWTSDVDGLFSTEGPDSGGSVAFTVSTLSVAEHTVTAVATDPDGLYSRAVVVFRVNGLPSAPVVEISPDPPATTDDLTVSIVTDSVDPEGATVTYTYSWTQNGVPRTSYTTDVVPASATAKGDVWKVVVTPQDDHGSGASASDEVTVENTPPTAPSVSIIPGDPLEGVDDFQCVVDVDSADDDGDAVTYTVRWKVDGSAYTGASTTDEKGDTILGTATTAEEEWECTVTPSDGTDSGTAGTATVWVLGEPIDYAHVQYPCSGAIARTTGTLDVYAWVYHPGVTDDYGQGAGITGEVGVGDDATDPETHSSWVWTVASYNDDKPAYGDASADPPPYSNDEYLGTISAPSSVGSYDYAYRFSTDSGLSWVYVDLGGLTCGGDGTIDGYSATTAGQLTVYP